MEKLKILSLIFFGKKGYTLTSYFFLEDSTMFLKMKIYQRVILLAWLGVSAGFVQAATDCNQVTEIPVSECQSLLELYNSTNGANWIDKTGWNQTNTPCSWFGVFCDSLPNVTNIQLPNNNLVGTLPNLNLPKLWVLWVSENPLTGIIPNFTSFNLANLGIALFKENCGLAAYDAAQENTLNQKDPNWKTKHVSCGGISIVVNPGQGGTPGGGAGSVSLTITKPINGDIVETNVSCSNSTSCKPQDVKINCGAVCSVFYYYDIGTLLTNTQVTLTAMPTNGYKFVSWSGDCSGTTSPLTITMDKAKNCSANFAQNAFTVTLNKIGTGSGTVSGDGNFAANATVNLTATPDANSTFTGWSSTPCNSSFIMPANNLTCTATFVLKQFALNISKTGNGTISANGINCGTDCSETYNANTQVTLTATPTNGFKFVNWSGDCSGTTSPLTIAMDKAKNCSANFTIIGTPKIVIEPSSLTY